MNEHPLPPLFESTLTSLPLAHRGKVRDIYTVDQQHLLIVTTDRLSAFDVVLPTPIPDKGRVLVGLSNFWFHRLAHVLPNHLTHRTPEEVLSNPEDRATVAERAVVVRRLRPLPIEAIVRGYLVGSGWKEYCETGAVCGIRLPKGLREADCLPEPIFTPSTKAAQGAHDENIDFDLASTLVGEELAKRIQDISITLYQKAARYARERGILIADTKFEFGLDDRGALVLIDEVLTPDSSRFWPMEQYAPGRSPPSFDKQYVRNYLESIAWNKRPPGPVLPPDVVTHTSQKYHEALQRLTRL